MAFISKGRTFTFRSRDKPYPPSRYRMTMGILLIISLVFWYLYFENSSFATMAAPTGICSSVLFLWLILASIMTIGIDYFEYKLDDEKICLFTQFSNPVSAMFWEFLFRFQTFRGLRSRPCIHLKNVSFVKETTKDGSRVLFLRERGFLTERGGNGLWIYLPDENADEIAARIRTLISSKTRKA